MRSIFNKIALLGLAILLMAGCDTVATTQEAAPADTVTAQTPSRTPIEPENAAQVTDTAQITLPAGGRPQFNTDGSLITLQGYQQVIQVNTASLETTLSMLLPEGRTLMAVAPDGVLSAWTTDYYTIDLMELGSDVVIGSIDPGYILQGATFSPDGSTLALVSNENWQVELWDVPTLTRMSVLEGFQTAAPVYMASFTHDPDHIVYISRATAQVQDIHTGVMSQEFFHEDFIGSFDLTWQGDLLATTDFTTINNDYVPIVQLWDVASGESGGILTLADPATQVAFSPDGRLIAVATAGTVQLWDRVNQNILATLSAGSPNTVGLAFSPDGAILAACDDEGLLVLWQVAP